MIGEGEDKTIPDNLLNGEPDDEDIFAQENSGLIEDLDELANEEEWPDEDFN